ALKGKIAYMSPEQISTDSVDRRTDIYAASVVLWEMLTGKRLYQADHEVRVIQKVLSGQIEPPSKLAASVPRELDALVMRGLARDPNQRFATAYEMAEQVQRIAFATPGQVSEWVQKLGAQAIEQRAKKIAEVESRSSPGEAPPSPPAPAADDDDRTEASEPSGMRGDRLDATRLSAPVLAALSSEAVASAPAPGNAGKFDSQVSALNVSSSAGHRPAWFGRVGRLAVALGVGLGTLLIGGIVLTFVVRAAHDDKAAPGASTPAATPTETTPPAPAIAAPPSLAAPLPTPSASATAALPTAAEHAHAGAPPQHAPASATHPKPSCNPPYTIKDGIRIPKMECL
ncbi:MAG TPA: protein kinase, partial [Polyangiaceae bacterium]|nr:protein kinase [Polyangiaceae bacterium]